MDDLTVRLVAIAVAAVVVALFASVLKRVRSRPLRSIAVTGLEPGTYLFTSGDCSECARARTRLAESTGPRGYTEVAWESEPGVFQRLEVDAVPSTLVVADDGSGVWHAGGPRNP